MHENGALPRAREDGLLEEAVGEELLLYDQESHTAHCLSPVAACIWRYCDGGREVAELARLAGVAEDVVSDALRELSKKSLLAAELQLTQGAVSGVSRREAIVRGVRYGAAVSAVPLIISATAATPAMASSGEYNCTPRKGEGKHTCCLCQNGQGHLVECINDEPDRAHCEEYCKSKGFTAPFFEEESACVLE